MKRLLTTAYHPWTDGLVERFNRTLIDMLSANATENVGMWDDYLPLVTLVYNTSKHSSLKDNPFYFLFERDTLLPNESLLDARVR